MDASFEDIQSVKIPPLSGQESQKKKRPSKKKSEAKPSKVEVEVPEVIPDTNVEAEADLINYTYKLEYELAATKKKIKQERKKFRQVLHSFAKNMDTMGITASLVDEYIQSLNPQSHEPASDSEFEKLFTTHKYQVIDDSGHMHNGNTLAKATSNRKSVVKSQPNLVKGVSGEKSALTNESTAAGSPHEQGSQQPSSEKRLPKPKKEKIPKPEGESEPKKRKPKKPKEVVEENDNDDVIEIPQIPPLDLKPKKDLKVDDRQILGQQQPQHQQYQQAQAGSRMANPLDMIMQNPNMLDDALKTLMQQVNIDPNQLMNMSPYLMMNAGNQPQIQENDAVAYERMLQEMLKSGNANQMLGSDKEAQDLLNLYQRSFK